MKRAALYLRVSTIDQTTVKQERELCAVAARWDARSLRSTKITASAAVPPSALVFGDLVEDRLPRLLLLVNEDGGLGGRHRIGVAP